MDPLRKTRSEPAKKINVRVIQVKPASDMWINDDATGWKIAGKEELLAEQVATISSSQRTTPREVNAKVLEGEFSVKKSNVPVAESVLKHSEVSEADPCFEVTGYDSDEGKVGHIQLKPQQRKSILKIPSDLSSSRLNLKTENKPSMTDVPPRSIQVRTYNQKSSSSVIGFDLNAGKVLREDNSRALVIHHSKSTARELPSGECPALKMFFGNTGASCSNISPNSQFSLNHQLKPDAKFCVNRNKSWKTPEPLETKITESGKKKKSKKGKKEGKVSYTPVEKFVEPTDRELKGKKKMSKNLFKMLTKKKSKSSSRSVTTWHIGSNKDCKNNIDRGDKFK